MKTLVLALIAGSCCSAGALGQVKSLTPMGEGHLGQIYKIDHDGNIVGEMSPYEARDVGFTYRNNIFDSGGYWDPRAAGNRHLLEDISFTPGPWSTVTPSYSFSRIQFSLYFVGTPAVPAQVQYKFLNAADCNFLGFTGTGTPMVNAAATPVFTLTVNLPTTGLAANTGYGFFPVNFAPFTLPAGNYFVDARIINPTTGADLGSDVWRIPVCTGSHAPTVGTTAGNPCTIGSTGASYGCDLNFDGTFAGGAANTAENVAIGFNVTGQFWNVGMDLALGGDIPATAPNCQSFVLGADNAFSTDTAAYTAAGVKWYCVSLASNADDAANKYVDFDTEGSAVDAAIAIYTAGGSLIVKDENSGSGNNAQLSFGIGRRAAVGDGLQYDGRNWNTTDATSLGLAPGTYYVAVAPSGVGAGAVFADGYSATGNGAAGNITLRVRTNVAGGALDPSVAPISTRVIGVSGEDPIVAPGGQITPAPLTGPGVLWYDVNLCNGADGSNAVSFDTTGTTALGYSITLFDGSGNQVSQTTGSSTAAAVLSFGGSNAALAAGHYYLAMTYDAAPNLSPTPNTAGRWHVRAKNGSQGYNFALTIAVPWNSCAPACGTADFNCDGDVGTDADINAFFACLAGICPSLPCTNGADFNDDGDVGTDADIDAFFRVLSGGTC